MTNLREIGIRGNTYDVDIQLSDKDNNKSYVKIGNQVVTTNRKEVHLFLRAYRMGRDHKKNEIRTALGI